MSRKLITLGLGLVLALTLVLAAGAGPGETIRPLPDGTPQVMPPASKAACQLTNYTGPASYYYDGWQPGWRYVEFFNPDDCGSPPTYPFEITSLDLSLYDNSLATWPCTLSVVVFDAELQDILPDTCYYPGIELCRQIWVCEQAVFEFPTIGTVDFLSPCCVDGPVFVGIEYNGAVGVQPPSIVWEDPYVDTCDVWVDTTGTGAWLVQHQSILWGVGYTSWWVNGETDSPNCVDTCNWQPGDPHKMHHAQLPDTMGWDVCATSPVQLADDWMCSETGWVKDIHFWGGWKDDLIGDILQFNITIYEDIPADQSPTGYSMPGAALWWGEFPGDDVTGYEPASLEGWYNPNAAGGGIVIPNSIQLYWQYDICLDSLQWFWQDSGIVYWLGIEAFVANSDDYKWGWKSSQDHWNDDAVWDSTGGNFWQELYEPGGGGTWDTLVNGFWVEIDEAGMFVAGDGENAYGNGWYFYPWYDWWNIWFYDHPFDTSRYKTGLIDFYILPRGPGPMWAEIAVNWSTDIWAWEGNPDRPPLPGEDEDLFIGREVLFASDFAEGHYTLPYEIPNYNPEWVSIDVRGFNFIIPEGIIVHECRPKNPQQQSLDLSFVITGSPPEEGACCDTFGNCYVTTAGDCAAMGGLYEGNGTTCTPNPCDSCDFQNPGDINGNNILGEVADLVYLINFLYQGGPTPPVIANADVNGDCCIDWRDIKYMIEYLFAYGPPPVNCTCIHPPLCLDPPVDHVDGKVYHNQDGYLPTIDPTFTDWHELYPQFCEDWTIELWRDNGDGYLSHCDTIRVYRNGAPADTLYEHVILVTTTVELLDNATGGTMYLDLLDPPNPLNNPITDPWGTIWHEVWPNYCTKWQLVYWNSFLNPNLMVGDQIFTQVLDGPTVGQIGDFTVMTIQTDIVTEPVTISCCVIRGDVNHNGVGPDIADLVYLVGFMFTPPSPPPPCEEPPGSGYYPECDVDGNGTGPDIADVVYLVSYMFSPPSPAPVPCP